MVVDAILVLIYIYLLAKVHFMNLIKDPDIVRKLQKYILVVNLI